MRDLGLSYEVALHGVQSAVKFELGQQSRSGFDIVKHLRVGLDARAADAQGLVELLIGKGIITESDYLEAIRLSMNEELARYTQHCRETYGLPSGTEFR